MEYLNSNSQERELHQLQQMLDNAKENCMKSFWLLHSFLQVLSYDESKSKRVSERAFMTLFGQDNETFTSTMFLYVDQLQNQIDKDEFHEDKSMAAFWVLNNLFQMFIDWQYHLDYDSGMTENLFAEYTGITVKQFRDKLIQHMENVKKSVAERTIHQRQYERRVNKRQMHTQESNIDSGSALHAISSQELDADLVVMESNETESGMHDTSNSSGTYTTHAIDANIRPVNDQVPFAEVQLTAQHNVLANKQQHTKQSEPIYDTYLLEKVDGNTTLDSTNMCHMGGEIDQDAEQYKVKSPLLKAELDAPKFCKFFEINDLKAQLQAKTTLICNLNNQIKSVVEASNEAKVKHEIDVIETTNIELEYITPHYLPKVREYVIAKPHHVIAPGSFRNSQEEPYGSNDMAHNHYLEEARKKTQERNRNSKPSVMHTTSLQNTTNGSKPNPRSNNQISRSLPVSKSSCGMSNGVSLVDHSRNSSSFSDSKHFVCSTCHKCVFNANHDNCITKFLKEVNSRAKVQSPKTRNNNKPVVPKSHTQKPGRQIAIGQRFSPKKSSAVHEKPNTPRSCLRWKPTGRIFKIAGLRWIPTGKMFTDNTTKVDSEPSNGSNDDITNSSECDQTLNVSAGLVPQPPSPTPNLPPIKNDWGLLFCPMFDEYFNPSPSVVQPVLVVVVQEPVVSTGTPSSTRIDQDTPSTSTSQTTQEEQSHVIPTSVEEDDHGIEVAHMDNDL
ncbi:hypothetical protein Tco_0627422 [Tanacetum coccineum]|uniref:Uncharacterized protein n=1 Tax=Tanacetum coccineum TaxID=301880 RepID=A0ABQ4WMC4_9ASTR